MSLGHLAGQTGVYRPVSQGFPVVLFRKLTEKGSFAGDTRPSCGFSEIFCDYSYAPFLLPSWVTKALLCLIDIVLAIVFARRRLYVEHAHAALLGWKGSRRHCNKRASKHRGPGVDNAYGPTEHPSQF